MTVITGNAVDGWEFREDADEETVYGNGLLYGPPKTAKSTGAHTAPGRVLYLNWDTPNATRYGRSRPGVKGRVKEPKIPRFKPDTTPVFDVMSLAVRQAYAGMWDTIVSDTVGDHMRRLLVEQTNRARRPTMEARANAWDDIERWCRSLVEAPVNFIVIAHEMTTDGEAAESIPFVGSKGASQGGFGTKLKGMVDFIAYTGVIEVEGEPDPKYVAQLRPGRGNGVKRDTGSRFDALMSEAYRPVDLAEWFALAGIHTGDMLSSDKQDRQSLQEVKAA